MVEIARAVLRNARLIIFDEPTATLTPEEKRFFYALVDRLRKQGVSIVFISHALEEALAIADRIIVLREGDIIEEGAHSELLARGGHYSELYNTYFRHQSLDYVEQAGSS